MTEDEKQFNVAEANDQEFQEFLRQCFLFGTACLKTTVTSEGIELKHIENFENQNKEESL